MSTSHNFTTIEEIHNALDQKQTSVTELTTAYLKRIEASKHNAFLHVCKERALKQAANQDQILKSEGKVPRASRPLFGVPMGIKDNMHIEGVPTTCASKMLEGYVPPFSSTAVDRLERAGAISLGKLNLDEFAMGGSNENSAFGPVDHPTHSGFVPGGSSGGSATAVRADLCFAATGSDTGGSIRLPAHYCGVSGFKPTYGRISRYGLVAFSSSLDQIGPLTKTSEDCARIYDVMAGHDSRDSTSFKGDAGFSAKDLSQRVNLKGMRVGVPKEYVTEGVKPVVRSAMDLKLEWFRKNGAEIVDVALPHSPSSVAVYYVIAVSEASSNLSRYDGVHYGVRNVEAVRAESADKFYEKARGLFGPEVKRRIILGTFALSSGYYDAYFTKACQVRRLIQDDFQKAFQSCDLILAPVSTSGAFKRGDLDNDPLSMYLNDLYTIPANLVGIPAMAFPVSKDDQGLPIGLQTMAPRFHDGLLLNVAHAFEQDRKNGGGK